MHSVRFRHYTLVYYTFLFACVHNSDHESWSRAVKLAENGGVDPILCDVYASVRTHATHSFQYRASMYDYIAWYRCYIPHKIEKPPKYRFIDSTKRRLHRAPIRLNAMRAGVLVHICSKTISHKSSAWIDLKFYCLQIKHLHSIVRRRWVVCLCVDCVVARKKKKWSQQYKNMFWTLCDCTNVRMYVLSALTSVDMYICIHC